MRHPAGFMPRRRRLSGTPDRIGRLFPDATKTEGHLMGRYLLLWFLGIPLPILALIWVFGGLH
ncbi:MAG: hypothetical protein GC182_23510 [Rhodopseudomonas sp.]|nr:hypothetical protein [Rhodopseudomonas sp.]